MRRPEYIIRHISSFKHIFKQQENSAYKIWATINDKNQFKIVGPSYADYSYESLQMSGEYSKHVDWVRDVDSYTDLFVEVL